MPNTCYRVLQTLTLDYSSCNVLWNNPEARKLLKDSETTLPDPKPDLFFGFPVFRPDREKPTGLERSAPTNNFSLAKLYALSQKGLVCNPTTSLTKYGPYNTPSEGIPRKALLCFPFAVVELKHGLIGGSRQEFCYCQAANGASRALIMLEKLFKPAHQHENNHHVPAVVTFTGIGHVLRVWLAYSFREPTGKVAHVRPIG